jgi:hypothetical protein
VAEAHGGTAELVAAGPPSVEFQLVLPPARRKASEQIREAVSEPKSTPIRALAARVGPGPREPT